MKMSYFEENANHRGVVGGVLLLLLLLLI